MEILAAPLSPAESIRLVAPAVASTTLEHGQITKADWSDSTWQILDTLHLESKDFAQAVENLPPQEHSVPDVLPEGGKLKMLAGPQKNVHVVETLHLSPTLLFVQTAGPHGRQSKRVCEQDGAQRDCATAAEEIKHLDYAKSVKLRHEMKVQISNGRSLLPMVHGVPVAARLYFTCYRWTMYEIMVQQNVELIGAGKQFIDGPSDWGIQQITNYCVSTVTTLKEFMALVPILGITQMFYLLMQAEPYHFEPGGIN